MKDRYITTRAYTVALCEPLAIEDFSVQPTVFVSPPKWHLAHTTWFWEEFVLKDFYPDFKRYNEDFSYLFNSYYNNIGKRILRPNRGLMTRPSVQKIYDYRNYVNEQMLRLFENELSEEALAVVEIGLNHEQQHQELLIYDIKYILGHQAFFPAYADGFEMKEITKENDFITVAEGVYEIGHSGNGFCFDNERNRHKIYLQEYTIAKQSVTNAEFLEFVLDGGYQDFNLWHDDGWQWVNANGIKSPLYWHFFENKWHEYDLNGLRPLVANQPVKHISFYEAYAYAEWKDKRIPTEAEWEAAHSKLEHIHTWEWTNSAYLPYPGFAKAPGALGEYNGKFMVNQMVLRGGSIATPQGHSRPTYRNFFHPDMRWQYSGLRLAKKQ